MDSKKGDMTGVGRNKAVTAEQIYETMKASDRLVWSPADIAEKFDVSKPTVKDRFQQLEEQGWVESIRVSNVKAFHLSDLDESNTIERHKQSLSSEFTDKFVGLPTMAWTAVHPSDGPAKAGDKIQIRVEGEPGKWRKQSVYTWDRRREELHPEETAKDETQALISGVLYSKPTTPIEHANYPDDYDLEEALGVDWTDVEGHNHQILVGIGPKNYLVKPSNDAVFLKNVSIDWISPKGEGEEIETVDLSSIDVDELVPLTELVADPDVDLEGTDLPVEDLKEWREENALEEKG